MLPPLLSRRHDVATFITSGRLPTAHNLTILVSPKLVSQGLGSISAGTPVLRTNAGAARLTWRYEDRGNKVEEAYYGIDGKPVLSKDTGAPKSLRSKGRR
jgi:hypothetical protein